MKVVTLKEIIDDLEHEYGSIREASKYLGVDQGYLQRLRNGDKVNPSKRVLDLLGVEAITIYVDKLWHDGNR